MAVYRFKSQIALKSDPGVDTGFSEQRKIVADTTVLEDVRNEPKVRLLNDQNIDHTEDHVNTLEPEFLHVDRGMLEYFSNLECPSKDGARSSRVKARVAGGDKSILIWEKELEQGSKRVQLPVISINRGAANPNPTKRSPTALPVDWTYVNQGKRARLSFAPQAWVISYTLTLWTNQKTDAEYILRQISSRFDHGMQDRFRIETENHVGQAIIELKAVSPNSDIDVDSETQPKVRYDLEFQVEAWVPRDTVIVPTILGEVITVHETNGTFLEVLGFAVESSALFVTPFDIPSVE
jgi:hypothetical protein